MRFLAVDDLAQLQAAADRFSPKIIRQRLDYWTFLKAHGLIHNQLCGPLANSLFHHQPEAQPRPKSKLETAFHKADASIRNIIELLEAA